jgi:hypothetical protein
VEKKHTSEAAMMRNVSASSATELERVLLTKLHLSSVRAPVLIDFWLVSLHHYVARVYIRSCATRYGLSYQFYK